LARDGDHRIISQCLVSRRSDGSFDAAAAGTHSDKPPGQDVALIVGGGPGISASCARLFTAHGMRVGIAARNPDKAVLELLESKHGVRRYACDASEPAAVERLFQDAVRDLGTPTLVVHRLAGTSVDDNMADPDRIAETYLQLHRQHRSTWAFEVVLRPWLEKW
jgi:enoyl-[acyl-carrier-protein] reductase (NADH)